MNKNSKCSKPKCPFCKNSMVQIYTHASNYLRIGYLCKKCKRYKITSKYRSMNDDLYIGLKKVM